MFVAVWQPPTLSGFQYSEDPEDDEADVIDGPVLAQIATVMIFEPGDGSWVVAPAVSVANAK